MTKAPCLIALNFLICVNYYILRTLKDALMLTQDYAGAEAVPFLKTWALIPATVCLVSIVVWLSNRLRFRSVFTLSLVFFVGYFLLYTFALRPLGPALYPNDYCNRLQNLFPAGWGGFVALIRYWPEVVFYVLAECWAVIIWSVLFMGFSNEIVTSKEAEGSYPWMILAGNLSAIAAGISVRWLTVTDWQETLTRLTLLIVFNSLAVACLFLRLDTSAKQAFKTPLERTFFQSAKELFQSAYLLKVAFLIFGFNIVINLTEVVWKDAVLSVYPNPLDYHQYMNGVTIAIGTLSATITIALMLFPFIRTNWTPLALATPMVLLLTGFLFFVPLMTPAAFFSGAAIALMGSCHVILSRSARYTLLDYCKDLALIPLPSDQKFKAKSQIDGVGSRLGKAASSASFQLMLLTVPSLTACAPYIFLIVLAVALISILAVQGIGKEITAFHRVSEPSRS